MKVVFLAELSALVSINNWRTMILHSMVAISQVFACSYAASLLLMGLCNIANALIWSRALA
jgi:hypothetical protein